MEHRVDVHILHMPDENQTWWEICQDSLANEPINIHNVMGTYGDLRDSRFRGFSQGSAEYVSFVDPDDSIIPGAFDKCVQALDANPDICGVYTLSNMMDATGRQMGLIHPYREWRRAKHPHLLEIHQLTVMRRGHVMDTFAKHYDSIPKILPTEPWVYWSMALAAPWLALNHIGYNWRKHQYGIHKSATPEVVADIARTYEFIKKSW